MEEMRKMEGMIAGLIEENKKEILDIGGLDQFRIGGRGAKHFFYIFYI